MVCVPLMCLPTKSGQEHPLRDRKENNEENQFMLISFLLRQGKGEGTQPKTTKNQAACPLLIYKTDILGLTFSSVEF